MFYYKSSAHQNHYVLSFGFAFEKEDEVYQFAIAPPYSYSRVQAYLTALETKFIGRFERSALTKSLVSLFEYPQQVPNKKQFFFQFLQQQRRLELITIDSVPKAIKLDGKNAIRVIIVLARMHPGESATSFAMQGFLEFLLSLHPIAIILRQNFIFKVLPMVNPDGVFLGNNRCNLIGQDLNRVWNVATEFSHPTVFAIRNMLKQLDSSEVYTANK